MAFIILLHSLGLPLFLLFRFYLITWFWIICLNHFLWSSIFDFCVFSSSLRSVLFFISLYFSGISIYFSILYFFSSLLLNIFSIQLFPSFFIVILINPLTSLLFIGYIFYTSFVIHPSFVPLSF